MKWFRNNVLFILTMILSSMPPLSAQDWDVLTSAEKEVLNGILAYWETWMPDTKKTGEAPLISLEQLTEGLDPEQRKFLDRILEIDPKKRFNFQGNFLGKESNGIQFKKIGGQKFIKNGEEKEIEPQYLPENVYEAYDSMMEAMEKDLGKRLLVESGYRSPAYQLYTFLYYMPKHKYSLVETGQWVALPGYSEHGAPHQQAIDFINQNGENGEDNVEAFEQLEEYAWLQLHAHEHGFELSYLRGKPGITFEPWHWRWCEQNCEQSIKS